ncbi:hypothetical protein [Kutzneria sp. 744]|uniref:DUF2017 family protein n=1 Tax=Kutzneria sp. (strain 744) TaxID=345341 RepID=UPI0003EEB66D|nr:hypothetical protein [Kutzneria sp. 744]EWM13407.1 hypothetical protein KUTG_03711 [Kutzneria sp. 744]
MTEPSEFDVVVGENQVLIKLGEDVVPVLRSGIGALAAYIDHAQPKRGLLERRRFERTQRALLARLFPSVSDYAPLAEEFDVRWGEHLRTGLFAACHRVLASITDDGTATYPLDAVDDWIRVLGQTRMLWMHRSSAGDVESEDLRLRTAGVYTWMQQQVIVAVRPELAEVAWT